MVCNVNVDWVEMQNRFFFSYIIFGVNVIGPYGSSVSIFTE